MSPRFCREMQIEVGLFILETHKFKNLQSARNQCLISMNEPLGHIPQLLGKVRKWFASAFSHSGPEKQANGRVYLELFHCPYLWYPSIDINDLIDQQLWKYHIGHGMFTSPRYCRNFHPKSTKLHDKNDLGPFNKPIDSKEEIIRAVD